jgi:hypothetical protein
MWSDSTTHALTENGLARRTAPTAARNSPISSTSNRDPRCANATVKNTDAP